MWVFVPLNVGDGDALQVLGEQGGAVIDEWGVYAPVLNVADVPHHVAAGDNELGTIACYVVEFGEVTLVVTASLLVGLSLIHI